MDITVDGKTLPIVEKFQKMNVLDYEKSVTVIDTILVNYQNIGFLGVAIDDFKETDTTYYVKIFTGRPIQKVLLTVDTFPNVTVLSYPEYIIEKEKLLDLYVNNGFPFTTINPLVTSMTGDTLKVNLQIKKGITVKMGGIELDTPLVVSERYLERFLKISKGKIYNQDIINQLPKSIQKIPFLEEATPTNVYFIDGEAIVKLDLKKKKVNQFDMFLGVQPGTGTLQEKLTVTGQGILSLVNSFGNGESFQVEFQKLRPLSQELQIEASYPFLLGQFGFKGTFGLEKLDTTYNSTVFTIGTFSALSNNAEIGVYWDYESSNILTPDTLKIIQNKNLPEALDSRYQGIALTFVFDKTDDFFMPRRGFYVQSNLSAGIRNIRTNNLISQINSQLINIDSLYQEAGAGKTPRVDVRLEFDYYIPISKKSTVLLAKKSGIVYNNRNLLTSELFQLGGVNTIRGFYERSFFSDKYAVLTAEYRYYFGYQSFVSLFNDNAWIANKDKQQLASGFGIGMQFSTKIGQFSLSYGQGISKDFPLNLSEGKIHFGYVSYF